MDDVGESIQHQLDRERQLYRHMRSNNHLANTSETPSDLSWRQEGSQGTPLKKQDSDTTLARKLAAASKKASADACSKIMEKEQKNALKVGLLADLGVC